MIMQNKRQGKKDSSNGIIVRHLQLTSEDDHPTGYSTGKPFDVKLGNEIDS
jgi:hypothetical protein